MYLNKVVGKAYLCKNGAKDLLFKSWGFREPDTQIVIKLWWCFIVIFFFKKWKGLGECAGVGGYLLPGNWSRETCHVKLAATGKPHKLIPVWKLQFSNEGKQHFLATPARQRSIHKKWRDLHMANVPVVYSSSNASFFPVWFQFCFIFKKCF